jgi:hypothetical protein
MMDGLYDSCANDLLKLDGTYAYVYRKIDIRIRLFMHIYVYKNSRFFMMDGLYDSCADDPLKLDGKYICKSFYYYIYLDIYMYLYTFIYKIRICTYIYFL